MSHITNEERIERLNATLYVASCVPAQRLNQGKWTCDTTHCIGGWCGVSPYHNDRGLTLDVLGGPEYTDRFGSAYGTRAFMLFHGISFEEAEEIVLNNANLSGEAARSNVVRKLKALIRKYGGEVMYSYE